MSNITPTDAPDRPPINDAGDGQVISETRVKQGARGVKFSAMMVTGAVVALAVMFAIWWTLSARHPSNSAEGGQDRVKSAAAQSFNAPPSQPKMSPPQGSTPDAPTR